MKKLILLLVLFIFSYSFAQEQEINPEAAVLYNQTIAAFKANKADSAVIYIDKAIAIQKNPLFFQLKGKVLLSQKKLNDALAAFDEALKLKADDKETLELKQNVEVDIQIQKGDALLKEHKYDEAIDEYKKALEMNKNDMKQETIKNRLVACYQNKAAVKAKAGDYEGAVKVYDEAKGVIEDNTILDEKVKIYKNAAANAYQQNKVNDAIQYYDKALALNPNDQELKKTVATFYNNLAANEAKNKKYPQAIAYYNKSLQIYETDNTHIYMMNTFMAANQNAQLIQYADKLINDKKLKAAPYYFKAVALNATGKYQEAVDVLKQGEQMVEDTNFAQRCAKLKASIEDYLKKSKSQKK